MPQVLLYPGFENRPPVIDSVVTALCAPNKFAIDTQLLERQYRVLGGTAGHAGSLDDRRHRMNTSVNQVGDIQSAKKTGFGFAVGFRYQAKPSGIICLSPNSDTPGPLVFSRIADQYLHVCLVVTKLVAILTALSGVG